MTITKAVSRSALRLSIWMVVVLSLAVTLEAQSKKTSAARMAIEPEEHDFGPVRQDQKMDYEFIVRNTGTEDLEIRRIATSCGCTAAITTDRIVPPGGSTTLKVTLETRKYKGVVERSISLASNDPARVQTVRVKAFVEVEEP
ncbi:MAG: DUF1573 domain-containing protein [Vicinamibacteria bacterium]